jgi:hypothetical protein
LALSFVDGDCKRQSTQLNSTANYTEKKEELKKRNGKQWKNK